jgi:hypothetical protein
MSTTLLERIPSPNHTLHARRTFFRAVGLLLTIPEHSIRSLYKPQKVPPFRRENMYSTTECATTSV